MGIFTTALRNKEKSEKSKLKMTWWPQIQRRIEAHML